ncbi:hypothetical protein [Prosthecomicrobium sp. N25]|uniref:hypothetical protein n=1 Tax=Prosthecomicrobium sp. N25 TaxID=3129254 RepID=UPI0030779C57
MSPLYAVGETVVYSNDMLRTSMECKIIRVLPEENDLRRYHVRGTHEAFDRAVPEHALKRTAAGAARRAFKA